MNILGKYLLSLVLFLFFSVNVFAQFHAQRARPLKANSHFQLGELELDFNENPTEVRKTTKIYEIISSIYFGAPYAFYNIAQNSDKLANVLSVSHPTSGELRFVVTPRGLYGKDLELTPNGDLILPLPSENFERALIVAPIIHDDDKYYLFSLSPSEDKLNLLSSIINTNLNDGKGDLEIMSKNKVFASLPIEDAITEIVDIVPGNNCDYWLVIAHNYKSQFKIIAYNITENGVNSNPSISSFDKAETNSVYWDVQISPGRNLISYITSNNLKTDVGFFNFNVETGYASNSQLPNINVAENSINTRSTFTPDNTGFIIYSNVYENGAGLFYKYDLRAYQNEYRKTSFTYPFKYHSFNEDLHVIYVPPMISFRTYNQNLFFNIPQSIQKPHPLEPSLRTITINGAATSIIPLSTKNGDWQSMQIGSAITLSNYCRLLSTNNIVYPYTESDTIPNVYLDSVLCLDPNSTFPPTMLRAKEGFENYVWNDGSTGAAQQITTPGKYWVFYKGDCNNRVDTFNISLWKPDILLGSDTIICEQRFPITLEAGAASQYLWDDNSTDKKRWIQEPGKYWVQFQNYGCVQRDSIVITSKFCPCDISLPNAFSPNGDGLNDYFKPIIALGCVPQGYSFRIFNRWGQLVYSSFDEFDIGWDGNKNGLQADAGNYIYEVRFKSKFLDNDYYAKGELMLVR